MKDKLKSIIKEIMDLDVDKIDWDKNLKEVDEWDSFNNLMLIAEIENQFDIKFSAADIEGVDTVNKIFALVESKLK